jgi:hypothetical protein
MNNHTQEQPEGIGDALDVFDAINNASNRYLSSNTASCLNGNLAFAIHYTEAVYDENGEYQGSDLWGDDVWEVMPRRIGELLTGRLADAVRRLLHSVEPYLAGETLNIYMADKSNRSARGVLDNVLAELGMGA